MSDFDFLEKKYPALYCLCMDVERYKGQDRNSSLLKCRQAIEYIAKDLLEHPSDDLFDNINRLENNGKITQQQADRLHSIRRVCNQGVHNEKISSVSLESCIRELKTVVKWYVYTCKGEPLPRVRMPLAHEQIPDRPVNDEGYKSQIASMNPIAIGAGGVKPKHIVPYTEMQLTSYQQRRDMLQKTLLEEENLARSIGLAILAGELEHSRIRLTRELFRVVVIGEFSRGKSSFINAMMGHRILPSSKRPTTSIISKIIYGDTPCYTIHYHDGKFRVVTEDEFLSIRAQYDTPTWIKGFLKKPLCPLAPYLQPENIEEAEIAYPFDFCQNQVEFIDTPGTNYLDVMRDEIKYNYLKNTDAVILVLSATQPLSKSEVDFLKERVLANQIQSIFVVVNYKDQLVSPDEEALVLRYVQNNIYEITHRKLPIVLVSSLQALYWRRKAAGETLTERQEKNCLPQNIEVTGFPDFERLFSQFLLEEKGREKLHRYATQGLQVMKQIDEMLMFRRDVSIQSVEAIRAELQTLHKHLTLY